MPSFMPPGWEEKQREISAMLTGRPYNPNPQTSPVPQGGLSGGMANPYADPNLSIDVSAQEKRIGRQQDIANAMRTGKSPQGRTVGPYNVYVGPNWGEVVGDAAMKLGGGYFEGKANEKEKGLDVERQKKADAEKGLQQALYQQGRDDITRQEDRENARFKITDAAAAEALKATIENRAALLGVSKEKLEDSKKGTWDDVSVQLPNGDAGTVVFNAKKGEYRFGDAEGEKLTTAEATKLLKFNTTTDKLPASMQKDLAERRSAAYTMADSIKEIDDLAANGQETSGNRGLLMSFIPEVFKGKAENALFDKDEMKQRAKNTYIDAQVKEAITTGVISDQDAVRLAGLNVSAGGLTPQQQTLRLYAITEIMGLYGLELDTSGVAPSSDGERKNTNDMTDAELEAELSK